MLPDHLICALFVENLLIGMPNLKSGKWAHIDVEQRFLPPDSILAVLRDRILDVLPIALNKIWFRIGSWVL